MTAVTGSPTLVHESEPAEWAVLSEAFGANSHTLVAVRGLGRTNVRPRPGTNAGKESLEGAIRGT